MCVVPSRLHDIKVYLRGLWGWRPLQPQTGAVWLKTKVRECWLGLRPRLMGDLRFYISVERLPFR